MAVNYQVHHTLEGGTNKTLWMNQLRPRTRKITHCPSGQTQTFSVTMKNSVIISILWMCVPAVFLEISTSVFTKYTCLFLACSYIFIFIHSFIRFTFLYSFIHPFIRFTFSYSFIHLSDICILFKSILSRNYRFFSITLTTKLERLKKVV